jgi:hypothetical protein
MEEQKKDAKSPQTAASGGEESDGKSEKIDKVYDIEGVIGGAIAGGVIGFIVSFDVIFAIQIGAFLGLVIGVRIKKKDDSNMGV